MSSPFLFAGGGGAAPGEANWQTLFDEDMTGYPATDLAAGETYTTSAGDLWDIADARTTDTNMSTLAFVNGSGLHMVTDGLGSREWIHQRNLAAAATAVGWTMAAEDEVVMATQQSAEFTGGAQTVLFLALRLTARTQGFTVNRRWATTASRIMYANNGSTTDQSSTVARSAGVVTAIRVRRGSITMYSGSSWPSGGDLSGMTVEGYYGEQDGDPGAIVDLTSSSYELELTFGADTAQNLYLERWGAWVRH